MNSSTRSPSTAMMRASGPIACGCSRASGRRSASSPTSRRSRVEMSKWVYRFGGGKADGRAEMKNLLGGKGANLAEMSNLGLPVPPGFTITTEVCTHYYANGETYPAGLEADVRSALGAIEMEVGRKF